MSSDGKRPNVFAVARSLWDHPIFDEEPFAAREAWIWLIGAATWKDTPARGNAGPVDLKRGEFSFSVRFLAEKWQWSKSRVDRFFSTLENRDMLRDTSRDGSKVYLILNYNRFQIVGVPKETESGTLFGTAAGQQRDKEETLNTKQRKKDSPSLALGDVNGFEEWYASYPHKVGRPSAKRAYAKALSKTTPAILLAATKHFATTSQFKAQKFIAHPATWLNDERWESASPPPDPWQAFEDRVRATMGDEAKRHLRNFKLTFGDNLERAAERLDQFARARRPDCAASEWFFAHGHSDCSVGMMQ